MKSEGDRLRESMIEYLDGAVSPEALERLNRAVENDPAARRDLAELMLHEGLLFRISQESRVFELDAPESRQSSAHTTSRILAIRRRQVSHRRAWMAAAIAAAVLFTVSLLTAVKGLRPVEPKADPASLARDGAPPSAPPVAPVPDRPTVDVKPKPASPPTAVAPRPAAKPLPSARKPKAAEPRRELPRPNGPLAPDDIMALPQPEKIPALPPPLPPAPPVKYWETVIARVDRIQGEVILVGTGAVRKPIQDGQNFLWGQALETAAVDASAALVYPDGTKLELGARTALWEMSDRPGSRGAAEPSKRILVTSGTVTAEVAPQPAARPMILSSPAGEAKMLSGSVSIVIEPDAMRLEVKDGKVQVTRKGDQATIEVAAGSFIVVGIGFPLEVRPIVRPR